MSHSNQVTNFVWFFFADFIVYRKRSADRMFLIYLYSPTIIACLEIYSAATKSRKRSRRRYMVEAVVDKRYVSTYNLEISQILENQSLTGNNNCVRVWYLATNSIINVGGSLVAV